MLTSERLSIGFRTVVFSYFDGVAETRRNAAAMATADPNAVADLYEDHPGGLTVRSPSGESFDVKADAPGLSIDNGGQAPMVTARIGENGKQYVIALRNHESGETEFFAPAVNDVAGPPMHSYGIILALVVGAYAVLNLSVGNLALVGLCAAYFFELFRRRKKIRDKAGRLMEASYGKDDVELQRLIAASRIVTPGG